MTLVMEKTEARASTAAEPGRFELSVSIGKTAAFGFLLDPAGKGSGVEHYRRGRNRLPHYFDWLHVPSETVLSLVDELMPRHPEIVPPLPFCLLVAPRWAPREQAVEVFVNSAFRRHNEMLVRVPSWAKFLLDHQPIERWVALQPELSRVGKVGLIGIETTSTGRHALDVFVRADDLKAGDLRRLAAVAGAPSGQLLHLRRSLFVAGGSDAGPTLLSLRLSGEEALDVGVSFPACRAGSSSDIQKRIETLASVYDLDVTRYVESIEEMARMTGRTPEHTMLGFSSRNDGVVLNATFESVAAPVAVPRAS